MSIASAWLPTECGRFRIAAYRSQNSKEEFLALCFGELRGDKDTLVRIHSQCLTGEAFGSIKCDCAAQLRGAMRMIQRAGRGAIVYQFREGRGIGIVNKIRAYALQDDGADTVEANERLGFRADTRRYEQCAEILIDLGLYRVRVISNNPQKILAIREAGLSVVGRVHLDLTLSDLATDYVHIKERKSGHLQPESR